MDGTGLAGFRADVAIDDDRIAKVGRVADRGSNEIDASGLMVTPGFIDGHTHLDAQMFWDPRGTNSCWHGVTTAVMGNCGFTLAPADPEKRHLVLRNLEKAEDIPGAVMERAIEWRWSAFPEYLQVLDELPKGINYVANIGHSALRTYAMGERAFTEPATEDDLQIMQSALRDALKAGACGLTSSRSHHHETSDGRPVASRVASWDELHALVLTMSEMGAGVFQLTTENDPAPPPEEQERLDKLLIELAVECGLPVAIQAAVNCDHALEVLDRSAAAGGRLFGLAHSRGVGSISSFRSQLPFDSLPDWQDVRKHSFDELGTILRDPAVRRRLVRSAHEGPYPVALGGAARRPQFERYEVLRSPLPPNRTVADYAAERGQDPVETMLDLALETNFEQLFVQSFEAFDHEHVRKVLAHPRTVQSFSDSGAHVSQMSDSSISTHLLAYWVREHGEFTFEEAVRMLTLEPARAWGFADRGLLREGYVADMNIIDAGIVAPRLPRIVHDLPGGAARFEQFADGFNTTIIGGQITQRDGVHTGAAPGRVLRRSASGSLM